MANTINPDNFNAVRNAAMSMGVTEDQLRAAMIAVGNKIEDLRTYFKVHKNPYLRRTKGWRM